MEPSIGETPSAGRGQDEFPLSEKVEGPISAAIIAAGIGAAALGLLTTLAEADTSVHDALEWSDSVGPLSGKTTLAVVVWLLAWAVLHMTLRNKPYETVRALVISSVLIALGVLGTFPEFFQLFA
ncbi:hypothetical protein [Streptomyces sp. DSM 40750]|uniref:hypothetical protein n=1 Tax=Streptomyces sp. DSM 40750 TaxID=2801030 RepID=UPI00214AF4EA|nr:hypothetical protein [Streptomyces sp. DSM 40750]UUU26079.1 hypothetical protein JIX55_40900 [Streptomyces sp. DSM 40750]